LNLIIIFSLVSLPRIFSTMSIVTLAPNSNPAIFCAPF
jgi:hypothetical protein